MIKKTAFKALFLASALTAGAFAQGSDTAYVPFKVNVDAKVTAVSPSAVSTEKNIRTGANRTDTLVLLLGKPSSVSYGRQGQANAPAALRYSRGNVSLNLHPRQYGSAEISLFSVNGKRVLRGKASALKAGDVNISKSNIVAGVYTLMVKGIDGSSFASKMSHHGGKLNINVAFGGGNVLSETAAGYGAWRITVGAAGYADTAYNFSPDKGVNPIQNITLRQSGPGPNTQIGCTRAGLTAAVDAYIAALEAGDHTLLPLASNAKYSEYDNASKQDYRTGSITPTVSQFGEGLWKKARKVDFHRNLIDTVLCATFSEVIINKDSKDTNDPPYVIGVRLDVSGSQISEVRVLVTTTGDWAFTASGYYRYSTGEDWSELPANQCLTRERLKSDAEAYFKYFRDKNVEVPWGMRCARLEGGAYTGDGPNASCNVGVPNLNMDISTIWWMADVDYGMVVLFVYFGGADSHWFRILPTGYRYIHTLTAMKQSDYIAP
jgi:hypothetical protein